MNRFLILLLSVSLFGCGGEKKESAKSSSEDGNKGDANTAATDERKPTGNESNKNSGGGGSRVRTENFFGRGKELNDQNKMKIMALAMHNFHDTFKKFPTSEFADTPMARHKSLSWRIDLLPFLEFSNEFDKFDKSQAWDSGKNKELVNARCKEPFVLSNGNLICTIKHERPVTRFREILDGSSNTVMLLENPMADGDKWTQSVDFSEKDAVKLIKSLKKGEYLLAVMYDGSTRKIHSPEGKNLTDKDVEAIFGYRDATPINEEMFQPAR